MITLNTEIQDEKPLIDEAHRFGAGLLVKKAFGSGHLTTSIPEIFKDLFAHPNITSAIVGTINPVHLRDNCLALPTEIQL